MNSVPQPRPKPVLRLVPRDEHADRIQELERLITDALGPEPFVPTRERPCPHMRTRGVWMADFRMDGNPILQAIDERGDIVAFRLWTVDKTREELEAVLWEILEARTSLR